MLRSFCTLQTGYVLGVVLLLVSGLATDFSLYILCSCTRRTGTQSYIQVLALHTLKHFVYLLSSKGSTTALQLSLLLHTSQTSLLHVIRLRQIAGRSCCRNTVFG
jgi:hypothetical protein